MTDYNSLQEAFNRLALMTERDALAQQLAASQAEASEFRKLLAVRVEASRLDEAQDTITRLEAKIDKALDLDYRRRQEIAEAVGLLRECETNLDDWMDGLPHDQIQGDRDLYAKLGATCLCMRGKKMTNWYFFGALVFTFASGFGFGRSWTLADRISK